MDIKSILFIAALLILVYLFHRKSETIGNWSHLFADMQHDPEEFYRLVTEILTERQVPDFTTTTRTFKEGNIFSHQRVYLEVARGDYVFHICAAPWGTSFFFSWWLRFKHPSAIGRRSKNALPDDTYYKADTDTMFRTSVHHGVLAAIEQLTETKGLKGLTELERKPDMRSMAI